MKTLQSILIAGAISAISFGAVAMEDNDFVGFGASPDDVNTSSKQMSNSVHNVSPLDLNHIFNPPYDNR